MYKVTTISYSLETGGAGIAANNIKKLLDSNKASFKIQSITQDHA